KLQRPRVDPGRLLPAPGAELLFKLLVQVQRVRDQEAQPQPGQRQAPDQQPPAPGTARAARLVVVFVVFDSGHGTSVLPRQDAGKCNNVVRAQSSPGSRRADARAVPQSAGVANLMPFSLADARFALDRALGLVQRGATSLRTRGWRATWQRVTAQFGLLAPPQRRPLLKAEAGPFEPFAVPFDSEPRASIVIPVYDGFEHTLACLRAIAATPPRAGIEVIVVDDGSSDSTAAALPRVEGLRYHRRAANGGFIAACNDGAALARGSYLVFLNNDTVPQPGWLDALLRTFEDHPRAGLVGAQLLYPDGRLQESGGRVLRDGRAESRGRFADPDHPLLRFAREVDYCSGAALAIERALFETLEGFDPRYAPAYYEDTDLAFRVRAAGRRVLCQPDARVVHVEGASAGTDPSSGMKAAQARNQPVFAGRWAAALASHPETPPDPLRPDGDGRPRILVIDALTPTPDRDSGSMRLVNLMRLLREEGAHVVFAPADRRHAGEH